jgi:hypothetical protein
MVRRAAAALLVLTVACTSSGGTTTPARSCKELGLTCTAERLPNVVLHGDDLDGALGAVDGFDLSGILTFDEALERGWYLFHPSSKTIRVVLGAANAGRLHWGRGRQLYYAIEYGGTCEDFSHPSPEPGESPYPTCLPGSENVVIDARDGRFIVAD